MQLPGVQDPQRAKDLIGRTALLEFKLVAEGPQAGTIESPGPGSQVLPGRGGAAGRTQYLVEQAADHERRRDRRRQRASGQRASRG